METITKLKKLVLRKQEAHEHQNQLTCRYWGGVEYIQEHIDLAKVIEECQEQIDKIILEA